MKQIIEPVDRKLIIEELTPDKFVRHTNNANNELYIFTYHNAPNLMHEVGRLRELTFRSAGGGTGAEVDIDEYDLCKNCYKQLIVWDPRNARYSEDIVSIALIPQKERKLIFPPNTYLTFRKNFRMSTCPK